MPRVITAREANQQFSRLLREVEAGQEFVVTRNGVRVARIMPEPQADGRRKLTAEQQAALADMRTVFQTADFGPIEQISREQLYDEIIDERIGRRRRE
jgi:prevent-host-death family protein